MRLSSIAICVLALSILAERGEACACAIPMGFAPTCERIATDPVAFLGVVIDDGKNSAADRSGTRDVVFEVIEIFKGIAPKTERLSINNYRGTSCYYPFDRGMTYLVFAFESNGTLITGTCSGNKRIDDARTEIPFLANWRDGKSRTLLKGTVSGDSSWPSDDVRNGKNPWLAGVNITASNGAAQFHTTSSPDGKYTLRGLPPGKYQITATLPGFSSEKDKYEKDVHPGACAELDISMWTASLVTGRLEDYEGRPVAGIEVELRGILTGSQKYGRTRTTKTGEDGVFEFRQLPVGDYVLGVSMDGMRWDRPYPPFFFPAAARIEDALVIHVTGPRELTGLDFRLLPPEPLRH
jgi:hypothetical protein